MRVRDTLLTLGQAAESTGLSGEQYLLLESYMDFFD